MPTADRPVAGMQDDDVGFIRPLFRTNSMISESVALMTVIDLLILGVISYGMWRSRLLILSGTRSDWKRIGFLLINLGLLGVALFYLADLVTMHILPMLTSTDKAMQAMEYLHGTLSWLVILVVTISISIGSIELVLEFQRGAAALRESEMQLTHANRVSAIGQMSLSILHEVTQPIASVSADAGTARRWLAAEQPNMAEAQEALGRVITSAGRARDVIDRIRTFAKKAPLRRQELAINQAILEVVAITQGEAGRNRISVQTRLTEGLPSVQGDRVQLQQVVLNLIINAVEAMSDSGEETRQLQINTDKAGPKEIRVAVQDSGPGIAAESVGQIFDPFYTTKSNGLGMGLSICRSIIEAHGGRLWASAAEPKGTVFAFTLPVHLDNPL